MRVSLCALAIAATVACSQAPPPPAAQAPPPPNRVEKLDPGLDAVVDTDAKVDKVATGFRFLEGPLWRHTGVLWFSDLVGNVVHQWSPDGKVTDILNPGGYDGHDLPDGGYIGPNGMVEGANNTVILCQHGNRRIVTLSPNLKVTVLVDKYQGKKLNSPNDVVYTADGALYFTDPPFGLPKQDDDPKKELKFNGVFRLAKGKLSVVVQDMPRPNGIAFSPDQKTLYLSNSGPDKSQRYWTKCNFDVAAGKASNCAQFASAASAPEESNPDGIKVDSAGNIFAAGPGGVWVFSPDGKHLGTIHLAEAPSNSTFGDDGKTLYITAVTSIYRVHVKNAGEKPVYSN